MGSGHQGTGDQAGKNTCFCLCLALRSGCRGAEGNPGKGNLKLVQSCLLPPPRVTRGKLLSAL